MMNPEEPVWSTPLAWSTLLACQRVIGFEVTPPTTGVGIINNCSSHHTYQTAPNVFVYPRPVALACT